MPLNTTFRARLVLITPIVLAAGDYLKDAPFLVQRCTHCHQAYRQCRRLITLTEVNSIASARYGAGKH